MTKVHLNQKIRRICHDVTFKAEVIEAKGGGLSVKEVIRKYRSFNVDKTNISKWTKNKTEIFKAAADTETKRPLKARPAKKYADLYHELKNQFSKSRQKSSKQPLILRRNDFSKRDLQKSMLICIMN